MNVYINNHNIENSKYEEILGIKSDYKLNSNTPY